MAKRRKPEMVSRHIYLYPKDDERWERNAERCGMSKSEYFRRLLRGVVPKEFPPKEYAAILQKMDQIQRGIRTQAEITELSGNTGSDQFWDLIEAYNTIIRELTDTAYDEEEAFYDEDKALYGSS